MIRNQHKNKPLIKESRFETIRRKSEPYKKIYAQNKKSETFTNWFYENHLLGYTYNKNLRDKHGSLNLPIATIERTSVEKDPTKKGIFFANVPPVNDEKGGSITIARRINQDKTQNFANADSNRRRRQSTFPIKNKKVVYQSISIPIPVYVDITYRITLRTEYQQQMNEMVTPFITKTGGINYFLLKKDGHRFESFIQDDFAQENNASALEADEKMYQTSIDIKVLGYLIGEDKNQETPKMVIRENFVEVKLPRERIIFGDIHDHIDKDEEVLERLKNLSDS